MLRHETNMGLTCSSDVRVVQSDVNHIQLGMPPPKFGLALGEA